MPYNLRSRRLPAGFWAKSSAPPRRRRYVARRRPAAAAAALPRSARRLAPVIKSVLMRQEETKTLGLIVENGVGHNAQIGAADLVPIIPAMTQGTAGSQRIGDKVKPVKLTLRGAVSYYDRGQTTLSPMVCKIFVLQWKGQRDQSGGFLNVPVNSLMDAGGSLTAWDGSTIRALCSVNREAFQVLGVRTIKISDADVENHKVQTGQYSMTVKCPATFNYPDGAVNPSNFAPFLAVGWFYEDGSTPAITDVNIVHTCHSMLYYKDA